MLQRHCLATALQPRPRLSATSSSSLTASRTHRGIAVPGPQSRQAGPGQAAGQSPCRGLRRLLIKCGSWVVVQGVRELSTEVGSRFPAQPGLQRPASARERYRRTRDSLRPGHNMWVSRSAADIAILPKQIQKL